MRFAPVLRVNASQVLTIRRLLRLVERQQGRIRVLERERDEGFDLAAALRQEITDLEQINAILMRTAPSDASSILDDSPGVEK